MFADAPASALRSTLRSGTRTDAGVAFVHALLMLSIARTAPTSRPAPPVRCSCVCASPAQEDEKLPPAPYETVKDAPGSNVDGEGAQWSSGLQTQGERAWQRKHAGCIGAAV